MPAPDRAPTWMPLAALAAAAAPSLLAYNVSPSATFLNQALALGLWGLLAAATGYAVALTRERQRASRRAFAVPAMVFAILGAATMASHLWGSLPSTLALSVTGSLLAAAVLAASGAHAGAAEAVVARRVFGLFCLGWVVAGLLNAALAAVQTFAPQLADGVWIARSSLPGRAVGNLRQPNHVSTLLLWATIASLVLLELGHLSRRTATLILPLLVASLVLTASRTAVVGVLLLAAWGVVDRRLSRTGRLALLATPPLFALAWLAMAAWSRATQETFGGVQRLAEADLSASRFRIWADTLELIRQNPLAGVGVGEFNFAWSLSVMPNRPVAFFDHAHNLFLHWAAEMGLPLTALVTVLLAWGLWRIARAGLATAAAQTTLLPRACLAMLLLIALHSQLEYPLWYAYFLLPTAWLLGFGLARAAAPPESAASAHGSPMRPRQAAQGSARLVAAGLLVSLGAIAATADYARVAAVFDQNDPSPLARRIDSGRRSLLFGHHADYAAATISAHPEREMDALRRAAHYLLDTRLMTAWAEAWAASGDLPRARYLAERLREFRNPNSQAYFDACAPTPDGAGISAAAATASAAPVARAAARPYQCLGPDPQAILRWSDFR